MELPAALEAVVVVVGRVMSETAWAAQAVSVAAVAAQMVQADMAQVAAAEPVLAAVASYSWSGNQMTTYARIQNSVAVEVFVPPDGLTIHECFYPLIAARFIEVPDGTVVNSTCTWTWFPPAE
ncbi:hypothetical protein PQR75_46900 [Paraburkholderia fungorum]|uniref:hypothetical protein n=1 Tax=Paraburkholderia fungorum TaxID=134537 RepID=UPI0038BAFB14